MVGWCAFMGRAPRHTKLLPVQQVQGKGGAYAPHSPHHRAALRVPTGWHVSVCAHDLRLLPQMEGDAVEAVVADAEQLAAMLQPMYKELQVGLAVALAAVGAALLQGTWASPVDSYPAPDSTPSLSGVHCCRALSSTRLGCPHCCEGVFVMPYAVLHCCCRSWASSWCGPATCWQTCTSC